MGPLSFSGREVHVGLIPSIFITTFLSCSSCIPPSYVRLQPVHVDGTVVLVPVLSFVVRRVSVLLPLVWPEAFLQLHQAGHVRGEVALPAACWRRLVAAILLILVGHHLLDAYHGLGLTDQRHLVDAAVTEK